MKITLAQLNPVVGDINGNIKKAQKVLTNYLKDPPDLVVFPELYLTGYPPKDLLEKRWFIARIEKGIQKIVRISKTVQQTGILIGTPLPIPTGTGKGLYNAALLIYQGKLIFTQYKSLLPTYDVFDETRYFDPAREIKIVPFRGKNLGITICEDIWNDPDLFPVRYYTFDPVEILAQKGADLFINISASPFHIGKEEIRYRIIRNHAKKYKVPFIFVNQVGANDELIFDGRSLYLDQHGNPVKIFAPFKEFVETVETNGPVIPVVYQPQDRIESVHEALILGIQDYIQKCGFSKAVVGLSGGIDSAVTCCLAKEALGNRNIIGVTMPGPFSSKGSYEDSAKLAKNLGIELKKIPISSVYSAYLKTLSPQFKKRKTDITEENIQARIRGNILMALANKFGYLVLSTGNKSELAVGYCTLYGDMSGGLAVISDVPKTTVYQLADYINRHGEIIPAAIIQKAPSAELKADQKDQDTLPPYDILDMILDYYVDQNYSVEDIVKLGIERETVKRVVEMVNKNEYKRKQAAPGLKVTVKAFGGGRRMPVAMKYNLDI